MHVLGTDPRELWGQTSGNWGLDLEHVGTGPMGNWGTDPNVWGQTLEAPKCVGTDPEGTEECEARDRGYRKGVYAWGGCGIMRSDEPPLVAGWSGRTGRNRRLR